MKILNKIKENLNITIFYKKVDRAGDKLNPSRYAHRVNKAIKELQEKGYKVVGHVYWNNGEYCLIGYRKRILGIF